MCGFNVRPNCIYEILNTLQNPLDPRNVMIAMHYFFKGEPCFQFTNVSDSSWCLILKFWSNKVNGTPSKKNINDYNDYLLCHLYDCSH
jgi:hypothetical protein